MRVRCALKNECRARKGSNVVAPRSAGIFQVMCRRQRSDRAGTPATHTRNFAKDLAFMTRFTVVARTTAGTPMRNWLSALLIWGLYPAWLLAGLVDYLCHRRTAIERTSGASESWLHVAQLVCLAAAFACAVLLQITAAVFAVLVVLVVAHSVLSYIDVRYTDGRRRILPIEQTVHGFMDVLPLTAVAVLGVQHWQEIHSGAMSLALGAVNQDGILLLSSFVVLAGVPVLEELLRTLRASAVPCQRSREVAEHHN